MTQLPLYSSTVNNAVREPMGLLNRTAETVSELLRHAKYVAWSYLSAMTQKSLLQHVKPR